MGALLRMEVIKSLALLVVIWVMTSNYHIFSKALTSTQTQHLITIPQNEAQNSNSYVLIRNYR